MVLPGVAPMNVRTNRV